ncbi:MAG: DUF4097 family beta strand repeat-containing protein [Nocardioides sp.]
MTDYRFETQGPTSLYVEIGAGEVTVSATDTAETRNEVTGDDADQVQVRQDGARISVVAPQDRVGFLGRSKQVYVEVVLPTGSEVAAKTGSADITVHGEAGPAQLRSGSGDVSVETLGGPALLETGSGDITVRTAQAQLRVKSGSGDVRIYHADDATSVSTGSGDIHIGQSLGPVAAKTGSGDLQVDDAGTDVSLKSGSGDCAIGAARRGRMVVTGASSDVRIGVPSGLPVWTDINTLTGDLHSSLESAGAPEHDDDPYVELRVTTVSGDIQLHQI